MINNPRGLVNDKIKKQVLEGLKTIAANDFSNYVNGDIKEKTQISILKCL